LIKATCSEFIGTALLLTSVVGSGIAADDLSGGITGLALLANSIATGAALYVLITIFGPLSGAHFNPVVSVCMVIAGRMRAGWLLAYVLAQVLGAVAGVWLAHLMFNLDIVQVSTKVRWGFNQWSAEAVAVFGLLMTIFGCLRSNTGAVASSVALYITSAYWFTSSTSFANPAVTIARSLSNTFAGIAPSSVLPFIVAQIVGAGLSMLAITLLFEGEDN
jgi:glycerol uptake facilitator-like aquaporin